MRLSKNKIQKLNRPFSSGDVARRLLKKKVNKFKKSIFLSPFIILSFMLVSFSNSSESYIPGPILDLTEVPELNSENVYIALKEAGVEHPEIVVKQAILETGWFKCSHCSLNKNNIFGFYYKKKYLEFDNWLESVAYYKKWQKKRYQGGDYYKFLKKVGYATSPTYEDKLKQIRLKFAI
jgi:hypothetical protein